MRLKYVPVVLPIEVRRVSGERYEKIIHVFADEKLSVSYWGCAGKSLPARVEWDPKKTKIIDARLRGSVRTTAGPMFCWAHPKIWFNDYVVWEGDIRDVDGSVPFDVEVMSILKNGENTVKIETCMPPKPWCGHDTWFTVDLVVTYEGEQPKITGPRKAKRFPWEEYLKNAAIGACIGAPALAAYAFIFGKPIKRYAVWGALIGAGGGVAYSYFTVGTEVEEVVAT
ncbi:MAG: hypothetical protein DRG31_07710 [Deltaproteobacteria bacterium]|nr:MAG: hypothetical protein DRG31_07710 [Deltaproteobacteria bacterium]